MPILFTFALVLCLFAQESLQAGGPDRTLPLLPSELLPLLPSPPIADNGTWKLLSSQGNNAFRGDWLITEVRRIYQFQPLPGKKDIPSPPERVELRVQDTGKSPGALILFGDFKAGRSAFGEKKFLNNTPAIVGAVDPISGQEIVLFRQGRFLFFITLRHVLPGAADAWITAVLDDNSLNTIPSPPLEMIPRPYLQENVDEIRPSYDSQSQATYTTEAEHEQAENAALRAQKNHGKP